jgi:imidazolonepropionase-like amidohydrolase
MTRTLLHGGRIFDGTGSAAAYADLVLEDGRISGVGVGLDGDEQVDVSGLTLLPGLFDCHVHVTMSGIDLLRRLQRPFSYQFFQAASNLRATLDCGITTVRDAGGADLGIQQAVEDGLVDGPRLQIAITALSQPATATAGCRRGSRRRCTVRTLAGPPGSWTALRRCASGSGRSSGPAPT